MGSEGEEITPTAMTKADKLSREDSQARQRGPGNTRLCIELPIYYQRAAITKSVIARHSLKTILPSPRGQNRIENRISGNERD